MQKIKKLTDDQARKIAAGEVVERSANIVKELVENSIDAGASIISIWINQAGKKLIRVVDNGCGMSKIDALICFERHATSKITTIEDLNTLSTFGFRGEALSSISSISKITMQTKYIHDQYGTLVDLQDGKITKEEQVSCSQGTDISIKDLFYNLPARLKFLKQDDTEWRQIVNLFQALCLSYQNIHFKLFHDDKLIYNCPSTDNLKIRLVQLWDHNFAQNTITISETKPFCKISGLISNHHFFRYNRSQIFFFINNRWIKNNNLSKALLKGYLNVLPKERFPAAFIFLSINPSEIDVNIHPRKEDVQFLNSKKIEKSIQDTVKTYLENYVSEQIIKQSDQIDNKDVFHLASSTTFDYHPTASFDESQKNSNSWNNADLWSDSSYVSNSIINEPNNYQLHSNGSYNYDSLMGYEIQPSDELQENNFNVEKVLDKKDYELIGQFNKSYILLEKAEGIFIIDQHAAHERVLYELFAKRFEDVATTRLIFPQIITLTQENLKFLVPYLELLHNNGIDCKQISKEQLIIESTPVYLKDISLEDLIKQFAGWVEEYQILEKQVLFKAVNEKLHAQMACKAAVKAGDKLTNEQIYKLLEDLNKTENRFACPHGRPTGWLMSTYDIEKKFKRR